MGPRNTFLKFDHLFSPFIITQVILKKRLAKTRNCWATWMRIAAHKCAVPLILENLILNMLNHLNNNYYKV